MAASYECDLGTRDADDGEGKCFIELQRWDDGPHGFEGWNGCNGFAPQRNSACLVGHSAWERKHTLDSCVCTGYSLSPDSYVLVGMAASKAMLDGYLYT